MDLSNYLEISAQSDPGKVRTINEDSIAFDAKDGLVVLADGMGGYNAGEVASGIAVSMIMAGMRDSLSRFDPTKRGKSGEMAGGAMLRAQVDVANSAIYKASQSKPEYSGMGTTLVAALFFDDRVCVAHLGDSRMYRLRGDSLELLTRDHSLLQEQLDRGMITQEEARNSQHKNLVTRALGIEVAVDVEVGCYDTLPDDIYLFCSDGLNDMLEDEEIRFTVQTLRSNLKLAANQLVELANDNGGRDNISVVLVKVKQEFGEKRGFFARLQALFRK